MNKILHKGDFNAPILIITEAPAERVYKQGLAISMDHLKFFAELAKSYKLGSKEFAFLNISSFVPEALYSNETKKNKFIDEQKADFLESFNKFNPQMILTLGKSALRSVSGGASAMNKVRGRVFHYPHITDKPVVHSYGLGYVIRSPQQWMLFESDFRLVDRLRDNKYRSEGLISTDVEYEWCTDLTPWLKDKPLVMSVDTETTGLRWFDPKVKPFMVQLCREPGKAIAIPVMEHYNPELKRNHHDLIRQVRLLIQDPNIMKIGHNYKYDYHMMQKMRMVMENWAMDTMQAAFAVNENMVEKSLAECVRFYVPEMAGYSDEFDASVDKEKMIEEDPEKVKTYGCGDADGCYRLAKVLQEELKKDKKQYYLFKNVQMPGLRSFADTLEETGVHVDEVELTRLGVELGADAETKYNELISYVPAAIKKKHLDNYKGTSTALSLTRDAFLVDVLFTKEGFGLQPKLFTDSTKRLPEDQKVPSVSIKKHLPYFTDFTISKTGQQKCDGYPFITELMEYKKLQKLRSTYVGLKYDEDKKGPTGFWQYIFNGKIHPSYRLDKTVTGRSSSSDPNGQNIPKRGKYAKMYRKIFNAPEGYSFIQVDYSQAELRVAAWVSNEKTMLKAYMDGLDLHALTAASSIRVSIEEFYKLPKDRQGDLRYKAKAKNFGLIYGMQPPTYRDYAYTDYGISMTMREAEEEVASYFKTYPGLLVWHEAMRTFAYEHGYVRALHGAKRSLPDIYSNDKWLAASAERMSINSGVQRFASDLGIIALNRISRDLKRNKDMDIPIMPCMFIHDALVIQCRDDYISEALPAIKWYMESNPLQKMFGLTPPIPILSDLEVGKNLGSLIEQKDIVACQPEWFTCD